MALRADIAAVARAMIATPCRHQGRKPGLDGGLDCGGLPVCIMREMGMAVEDRTDYRFGDFRMLEEMLDRQLDRVATVRQGTVMLFWLARQNKPRHLAVCTTAATETAPALMIHADLRIGRVVEHTMDAFWVSRLIRGYDFHGVED